MPATQPAPRVRVRTQRLVVLTKEDEHAAQKTLVDQRKELQKERFLTEFRKRLGLIMDTCNAMGIAHSTFSAWCREDKEFHEKVLLEGENTLDVVEKALLKKIVEGDTASIIFYLKTKGKSRGFSQRLEVTGEGGGPLKNETTLKISELQKEIPVDALDEIVGKVFDVETVEVPAGEVMALPDGVPEAVLDYAIDEEDDEERELELEVK